MRKEKYVEELLHPENNPWAILAIKLAMLFLVGVLTLIFVSECALWWKTH